MIFLVILLIVWQINIYSFIHVRSPLVSELPKVIDGALVCDRSSSHLALSVKSIEKENNYRTKNVVDIWRNVRNGQLWDIGCCENWTCYLTRSALTFFTYPGSHHVTYITISIVVSLFVSLLPTLTTVSTLWSILFSLKLIRNAKSALVRIQSV